MTTVIPEQLENALFSNHVLSEVLGRWDKMALPDCWLVAGAIVQSYWNKVHEFPPLYGVDDVDLIYFDSSDLSEASESQHASRISDMFEGYGVRFDVKNEARVHLWYESRFGYPIEPYASSKSAIDTFPTTAGSIGVRPRGNTMETYASFGFSDLLSLVVRPNKRQITAEIYSNKVSRWMNLWPQLEVVEWDDA